MLERLVGGRNEILHAVPAHFVSAVWIGVRNWRRLSGEAWGPAVGGINCGAVSARPMADQLGIDHSLGRRWCATSGAEPRICRAIVRPAWSENSAHRNHLQWDP